ncbi:MAG: signal peptidase II [Betaproteobacteria bacterium]|nr:signal peptidase II [Betaproteobacteria bacterium]
MTLFHRYLLLAALILLADQATKLMILANFELYEHVALAPFLNLTLVYNPGAAFSFLAGASGWQKWFFILLALGISVWIVIMLKRHPERRRENIALSLIMGGALGNTVDRLAYGKVVDFIDFHIWPVFNLADTSITLGAALLLLDAWLSGRARNKANVSP